MDTAAIPAPAAIRYLGVADPLAAYFVRDETFTNLSFMAEKAYAMAPFFLKFGDRCLGRRPLNLWLDINVAIDAWYLREVRKYLNSHATLINLGVGYDTNMFSQLRAHLTRGHRVFEVDFDEIIQQRLSVFAAVDQHLLWLPCPLTTIGCDVACVSKLERELRTRRAFQEPALVQMERLLMYFDAAHISKLLTMLATCLPRGSILLADFINVAMFDEVYEKMPDWGAMWQRTEKPFGLLRAAGWNLLATPDNDLRRLYKIGKVTCLTNILLGRTSTMSRFDSSPHQAEPMLLTLAATNNL